MQQAAVEERLSDLEYTMRELAHQHVKTEMELAQLSREMRDFKNEMREFKDEMHTSQARMEEDRRSMNRKWGDLANKMGTLVEDIVAPNLARVAHEFFGCGERPDDFMIRRCRKLDEEVREYDAIVVCSGKVLINETKSVLRSEHVDYLIERLQEFRRFFPEYADHELYGIVASLRVDDGVLRYAGSKGILAMGMGDETMELLNPDDARAY